MKGHLCPLSDRPTRFLGATGRPQTQGRGAGTDRGPAGPHRPHVEGMGRGRNARCVPAWPMPGRRSRKLTVSTRTAAAQKPTKPEQSRSSVACVMPYVKVSCRLRPTIVSRIPIAISTLRPRWRARARASDAEQHFRFWRHECRCVPGGCRHPTPDLGDEAVAIGAPPAALISAGGVIQCRLEPGSTVLATW